MGARSAGMFTVVTDARAEDGRGYFDAASSEPLHPAAAEVLARLNDPESPRGYADPRRGHHEAREARLLLDNARAVIAECLGIRSGEVVFTPSGTHAVHLGLLGLVEGARRSGNRLAASAVEHSSVMHAGRWHEKHGGSFEVAPVDRLGRVTAWPEAEVYAVQSANHEVGTVQDLPATDAPIFVDACATAGRLPLPEGWSALAASAHKWGGPAGVGILVIRQGARWRNPFPGDDRVDERATGFENVPGALAAAAALQAMVADTEMAARQHALVDRIRRDVVHIPDTEVVGDPDRRLPHLVTFSCLYVDGEALVTELDRLGFSIASGSACTSSALEPSHVLAAMGALTHGNVRVSLARDSSEAEVERFLDVLPGVVARIRDTIGAPR